MTKLSRKPRSGRIARTAAATVALCILGGVGTAYAYWATTGIGSGAAINGTMQTVTVDALIAGDTPQTSLVPGGTADVIVRATNPNTHAVTIYGIAANGAVTADAAHPGCTTTGVTFTPPPAPLTPTVTIQANTSILLTLQGAASMSAASLSACQGAQFNVPVTLEVRK
ncbi:MULTISPECIES: hypothetical protein [Micrococcaceae]|uniref:Ribosomally synthesized peptide with SipW-like signal peptide n=1 Tax=Paenarthrobacter aromaticivorans TaxID=2849150 RepID=A0ABS6IC20_9MICC|nr:MULTISPECIES: hypothetical protein [Micrococcaceae]MBU8869159.1 hypothetical protein [Paenarthrobacter sp. MMS21-TAE1-1]BCW08511.1 hypothetical protein NtRootA1_46490 [Arthrobacter sp. NtRootA1]